MTLESIPIAGQYSIIGILLALVVLIVGLVLRGTLVPKSHLDRANDFTDKALRAWELEKEKSSDLTTLLMRMTALDDTVMKLINSLPTDYDKGGDET